jgi:hypothetical protein
VTSRVGQERGVWLCSRAPQRRSPLGPAPHLPRSPVGAKRSPDGASRDHEQQERPRERTEGLQSQPPLTGSLRRWVSKHPARSTACLPLQVADQDFSDGESSNLHSIRPAKRRATSPTSFRRPNPAPTRFAEGGRFAANACGSRSHGGGRDRDVHERSVLPLTNGFVVSQQLPRRTLAKRSSLSARFAGGGIGRSPTGEALFEGSPPDRQACHPPLGPRRRATFVA